MVIEMEKENNVGLMEQLIKEIIRLINFMVKEKFYIVMEIII